MTGKPASKIDTFWPLTAAIWRNETAEGKAWYSTTFERSYRDKDGKTQSATSFGVDDLLVIGKLADLAHSEIFRLRASDRAAQVEPREPGAEG